MVAPITLMEREQRGENSTATVLEDLTTRISPALTQNQTQTPITTRKSLVEKIGIKLDGTNYAL